jgi:23S rRNA (pseudouridine1915-N3)-methyltransferase
MKLELIFVGSGKEPFAEEAERLYVEKLSHFEEFSVLRIKPSGHERARADEKRDQESEQIQSRLKPEDFVVAFSEDGKLAKNSIEFAQLLGRGLESGRRRMVFIIGGAFGLTNEIKKRADLCLSFSPLTLNHHVARVVALEQIYRALTIRKVIPYHN